MLDIGTAPREVIAVVQRLRLFLDVCPADCSTVISAAREKRFARRETIFFEGDPVQHVVMLLSGCVKITQLGIGGEEVILRLCGVGDVVGGLNLCADHSHFSTAQAVQPSMALVWQVATFEKLMERFPSFRRNTVRALEERLQEMEQRFREVSTEKVGVRLSSELLRLSNHLGRANGKAEIGLSRSELAQLTGTTMFSVSRLLSRWQTLGIVSSRREAVQVHDFAALAQFSQGE
jgi:CRP/FNR family transcriptional regulator, nitrogen oxide reductase regulator